MKMLVTGFEPSYGLKRTPSGECATLLDRNLVLGCEITGLVLPQVFRKSSEMAINAIDAIKPDIVVCLGAYLGNDIRLERLAINFEDDRSGDNSKIPAYDRKISISGAVAYETNVDCRSLSAKLLDSAVRNHISYNAGTHVCNSLYYSVLEYITTRSSDVKCIFVHIPFTVDFGLPGIESHHDNFRHLVKDVKSTIGAVVETVGNF